ncbi:DUF6081 family protein [Streptomyces boninensis]|uniref:DUF6081 family protein n=1 Tax=Streptomyces boninensis TaxID=2039455 RepID=UPI003B2108DD
MTSNPQTAHGDFVTYDDLKGPDLDPALWQGISVPIPGGGEWTASDPNAQVTVGEGAIRVTIPRFSASSDTFLPADSGKFARFTTREFALPPDRPATFAAELSVQNLNGEPADYRQGMAAFQVADLQRVFSVIGTSTRVFAMHEQLGVWGATDPFVHVVETPYADFDDDFTRPRTCEITFDRSTSTVLWQVDGQQIYKTNGTSIPEQVSIAIGIWTQLPLRNGRSRSLRDQGIDARWSGFRVRGAD